MSWGLRLCAYACLSCAALSHRLKRLQLPKKLNSSVWLLTVETRNPNSSIPFAGVPGYTFQNLGAGQEWHGWITKVALPARFFEQRARVDPNEIAILADAADVFSGGCTEAELLQRYHDLVEADGPNGPSVVFGSQFRVWPPHALDFNIYPGLAKRRDAVLSRLGLNRSSFLFALWEESCKRDTRDLCLWPRAYDKLNAGFVMGPVGALHRVFSKALLFPHNSTNFNDQLAHAVYMSEHPEEVTVDYGSFLTAELVYSRGMLKVENGVIRSKVHGGKQCFVHGNGNGCFEWHSLLGQIDPVGAAHTRECQRRMSQWQAKAGKQTEETGSIE